MKAAQKMDAFDIAVGTMAPDLGYTGGFSATVGIAGISSLVDISSLASQTERISFLGGGKSFAQFGLDFSFNLFGEASKYTYSTLGGSSEMVPLFLDIITGNTGGQVQDELGKMK